MSFACFDNDQRYRKVMMATVERKLWWQPFQDKFIVSYSFNELLCHEFSVSEIQTEIKVLSTNYSTDLILYTCWNDSESILVLTKNLQTFNGIPFYKPPQLSILNENCLSLSTYQSDVETFVQTFSDLLATKLAPKARKNSFSKTNLMTMMINSFIGQVIQRRPWHLALHQLGRSWIYFKEISSWHLWFGW